MKKGLLLYLPFSGNFADSSGNNNPTRGANGVTLTSDASGTASSAILGSGNGESVIVTNNGSIKFDTAFTVSVNVFTDNPRQMQAYVTMTRYDDAKGTSFGFGQGIPGVTATEIAVAKSSMTCDDIVDGNNPGANTITDTSNLTLTAATWYNMVATFHKGTLKIYANGTLISTKTGADNIVPVCSSAQVIVGAWFGGGESINGKLDEVRMYNRALNDKEIAKLGSGFPVLSSTVNLKKGLLLYLPFNGTLADSSGNNNPTQLVGTGAGLDYDIHGYANSAFSSDGSGGRIEVTNNGSIQFDTAFSVSLSYMERVIDGNQVLASLVKTEDGKGPSFLIGNSMISAPDLYFGVPKGITCDQYGTPDIDTTDFVAQPESWYNLIGTFHKGTFRVYVNGKLISQRTVPAYNAQVCPNAKFVVGGWWQGDPLSINGKIDNVRLYNRELSADEIAMLAQYYQPTTNSIRQVVSR